jgi:hypothetical protein
MRKRSIRLKIASMAADTAKNLNALVVLERLLEYRLRNMIKGSAFRHRFYQLDLWVWLRLLRGSALREAAAKVNLKDESSRRLSYVSKIMKGYASRKKRLKRQNVE